MNTPTSGQKLLRKYYHRRFSNKHVTKISISVLIMKNNNDVFLAWTTPWHAGGG